MNRTNAVAVLMLIAVAVRCGGGADTVESSDSAQASAPARGDYKYSSTRDGIDICFRKLKDALGGHAKVQEVDSYFSAGREVGSYDEPKGALTTCTADYQDPSDPKKLLRLRMDAYTGEFDSPEPIALPSHPSDYVIELGQVQTASLQAFMDRQKPALDKVYSVYAWDDIRLQSPGPMDRVHALAVRMTGRFKRNGNEHIGGAKLAIDGKTVVENALTR